MEEEKFTLLRRFQYSTEATIYQGKLESQGIEVFLRDQFTIDSNPFYSNALGGIRLFVKTEDFQKASEILDDVSLYAVEDDNQLMKCPQCGAEQIEMETSIRSWKTLWNVIWLGFLASLFEKHKYKCQNCKYEFNQKTN